MASNRIGRINEEIQRELSALIRTVKDPRVKGLISITAVDTTPDLKYAKVYVSVLDKGDVHEVVKGLKSAAGYLRRELGQLRPETALPLYVAVSTDTGCFMYGNTTPATHRVAAALMETGIDYQAANKRHFRTKSYKRFRLEALIVANMDLHDGGKLAVTAISLEDMARLGADERDAEDIAAFLGQLEGVETSVTIRELQPGECKLSVRTVDGGLNATRVCSLLGGGGHAAAAGCTVWGGVDDAKREILKAIRTVQHGG